MVDVGRRIVTVRLLMDDGLQRKAVGLRGAFARPSHGQRGHRHHQARQLQDLDNLRRHVKRGTQIADTKPFGLGQIAESLCIKQRIGRRVQEGKKIVISRHGLALLRPPHSAVEVGAKRQHDRRLRHHRLVEMRRSQPALHLLVAGHHHTVKLHIPHGLCPFGHGQQPIEQFLFHGLAGILPDASPVLHCLYHLIGIFT